MKLPKCPECGDVIDPRDDPQPQHHPMTIYYECPECGHDWNDRWCSAVDDECPKCGTLTTPTTWEEDDAIDA